MRGKRTYTAAALVAATALAGLLAPRLGLAPEQHQLLVEILLVAVGLIAAAIAGLRSAFQGISVRIDRRSEDEDLLRRLAAVSLPEGWGFRLDLVQGGKPIRQALEARAPHRTAAVPGPKI